MPPPPEPPTLSTARLIIRPANPLSSSDCNLIIQVYSDPFIGPWGFGRAGIRTQEDVIRKHRMHGPASLPEVCSRWMKEYGEVRWDVEFHLVFLKNQDGSAGDYIGFVGMNFRKEVKWPDFGYALFEQYNGKGYATEASKTVLDWWKDEAGVMEIWLHTHPDNVKSQACAKRCGFVEGGEMRRIAKDENGKEVVRKGRGFMLPGMVWPEEGLEIKIVRVGG